MSSLIKKIKGINRRASPAPILCSLRSRVPTPKGRGIKPFDTSWFDIAHHRSLGQDESAFSSCSSLAVIKKLPTSPGVYFFLGSRKKILYIGKAGSLRDRVRSYFSRDIAFSRSVAIEKMVQDAQDISFQKTDSVLEAVILEADLIKKFKPKYNTQEKDDKSFNHVVITKEDFPRILLIRGRDLLEIRNLKFEIAKRFGPFPQGGVLKEALKIIRKIFPFRDLCVPSQKQHPYKLEFVRMLSRVKTYESKLSHKSAPKPCFNRQIGLCPGVCTGEISKEEYAKTIRNIRLFFSGKKKDLIRKLQKEMKAAAKERNFEKAAQLRNTIFSLKHIHDVSLVKSENLLRFSASSLRNSATRLRVEAYDVAHLGGESMVGVMTVVEDGEMNKSEYRKFKIRDIKKANDTAALKQILERRLEHHEWPLPKVIVVDGGKAQVNVARKLFENVGVIIPVVGVVKDERHRPKNILGDRVIRQKHESAILLANAEAHRFAIGFHKKLLRKRT